MFCKFKLKSAIDKIINDIYNIRYMVIVLFVYGVVMQVVFGTVCPFKIITRMDCPGCGLTHGCISVLLGRWRQALDYNPMSFAWVLLIIFLLVQRYFLNLKKIYWEVPAMLVSVATLALWIERFVTNFIIR